MSLIASGSYGSVYALCRDERQLAVKVVKRTAQSEKEVQIAQRFGQLPGFVPVLESHFFERTIELTMPRMAGTLLDLVLKRQTLSSSQICVFFAQILRAVRTMHNRGYVHKDLKLENMLVDKGQVFLCDFGFARPFVKGAKTLRDNLGSIHYAAPELWLDECYEGPEVDVWALGVCLFMMSTGFFPFGGSGPEAISAAVMQLRHQRLQFPERLCSNRHLRQLIRGMLAFDPQRRLTLDEVKDHPFFSAAMRRRPEVAAFLHTPDPISPRLFTPRVRCLKAQHDSCDVLLQKDGSFTLRSPHRIDHPPFVRSETDSCIQIETLTSSSRTPSPPNPSSPPSSSSSSSIPYPSSPSYSPSSSPSSTSPSSSSSSSAVSSPRRPAPSKKMALLHKVRTKLGPSLMSKTSPRPASTTSDSL